MTTTPLVLLESAVAVHARRHAGRTKRAQWCALLALAVWGGWSGRAEACSPRSCVSGAVLPLDGEEIPANAPGILWFSPHSAAPRDPDAGSPPWSFDVYAANETVVATEFDRTSALTGAARFVAFLAPLVPGQSYSARWTTSLPANTYPELVRECAYTLAGTSGFRAGPVAPIPTTLGELLTCDGQQGTMRVPTGRGTCNVDLRAVSAELWVDFAPEVPAWLPLMQWETRVDDQPFRSFVISDDVAGRVGRRPYPPGRAFVFSLCPDRRNLGERGGVSEGRHRVRLVARIPGIDREFSTTEKTITLQCTQDPSAFSRPLDFLTDDPFDFRSHDAGASCPVVVPTRQGTGCAAAPTSKHSTPLIALFALWILRRRPRSRSNAAPCGNEVHRE